MSHPVNMKISDGRPLTPMQRRFVEEIIADGSSQTKAAIRAGYSLNNATQTASILMKDPRIISLLDEARSKAVETLGLTSERVLQELWKIAGANPGDVITVSEDGEVDLLPGAQGEVTVTSMTSGDKKARSVTTKTVKPADKVAALTQLAKIMNLFPKEEKEVKVALSLTELIEKSMPPEDGSSGAPAEIVFEEPQAV